MFADERDVALFFLGWRSFVDDADTVLAEHGLGRMHHRVLYVVARSPGISVGELASALSISRQALHRPLSDLRRRDLVAGDVPARSGRERSLSATPEGQALERAATGPQLAHLSAVFDAAGPAAVEGWRRIMRGLAHDAVAQASPVTRHLVNEGRPDDA
ncbi:MarR family winged helix-turn-helix transcriptional regulator [Nonomuraea basaltis]|uniref:MarR family winged helix-turn-helix transcriptional regulator n=1 Tax=Nonomuraea basaltis TaxID=2495887 RepID=UPI00110C67F5|nr:MarR family transcriptional regulator [Nonomuraea basaltis]TMR88689.1 MarR family transcriptional regulator [Nonomuraea basaltis]